MQTKTIIKAVLITLEIIVLTGCANRAELSPEIKDLIRLEVKNQVGNIDTKIQAGLNNNFDFKEMIRLRNEIQTQAGRDNITNKKNVINLNFGTPKPTKKANNDK